MRHRIYLSCPHMSGHEMKYIKEAFEQNWVAPLGPNVDKFEKVISNYFGVKYSAAVNSGTSAIHLALLVLGVQAGDEVIAPTFTFSATINPIVYQNALPILVDSERKTCNMCPELLEHTIKQRMSKGKKPKAIIPVHLYGMPANMKEIMEIADRYEIPVIEDAAEAVGSRYMNKPVASFGIMGILSFNGNKIITTSGGGALLSNEEQMITRARFLSTQARDPAGYYQHSTIGYNYRISNILAGIGLGQMEVIEERIKARRNNHRFYMDNLKNYDGVTFLEEPNEEFYSNHWLTAILIDPIKTGTNKDNIQKALEEENIESRPLWKPMHLQPVFQKCPAFLNGTSEYFFERGLCLPSGSNMSDQDRERVLITLTKALKTRSNKVTFQ